ncbi:thymidylate synthase [Xanthomonas phage vB_XciM_LucasX]|nr:thymidylate synthase [Xanthomonas phage vB_XciM_LucasX]
MKEYLDLLRDVRTNGKYKLDRTGVGCYSVFGRQIRFDLSKGLPAVTTKKLFFRGITEELLWIIAGSTNNEDLVTKNVHIWDEWALKEDETEAVRLDDQERLELYAKHLGLSTARVAGEHLTGLYQQVRDHSKYYDMSAAEKHGHAVMDEAGIPREKSVVVRPKGDLGPIYGKQWRAWEGKSGKVYDQLADAIALLKKDPASRRNVISAWNVDDLAQMSLNPCHSFFQFYAEELTYEERRMLVVDNYEKWDIFFGIAFDDDDRSGPEFKDEHIEWMDEHGVPKHRLSCQLYQRSADIFLGVPFNITSYAMLTYMVAQVVGMAPGEFVHTFGDLHIYANHLKQVDLQLTREPLPLPTLLLNPAIQNIDDFKMEDIKIVGYQSHGKIEGEVAV